jgi:tetratricopeptide (TPR) repeat protein
VATPAVAAPRCVAVTHVVAAMLIGAALLAPAIVVAGPAAASPDTPSSDAGSADRETVARHLEEGRRHLQRGAAALAISDLEAALAIDPDDAQATLALADALVAVGRYAAAHDAYQRVLRLDDSLDTELHGYADTRAALGDPRGALTILDRILDQAPDDAGALERAGALRVRTGTGDAAHARGIAELERALELEPTRLGAAIELGLDALRRGEPATALAHFERANAIRINERAAVHGIVRSIALLGRESEAAIWGMRFEAQRPTWEAVDREAERLLRDPRDVDAYVHLGALHNRLRHFERASGLLETAVELDPSRVDALRALALAQNGRQLFGDAESTLYRALELAPDDPSLHRELSACYRFTGSFELAGQHMARARELEAAAAARAAAADSTPPVPPDGGPADPGAPRPDRR